MLEQYISEYIQYLKAGGKSQNTIKKYSKDVEQFAAYMQEKYHDESIRLQDIDRLMIRGYLRYLHSHGLNNNSIRSKIGSLNIFFKYMLLNKYIEKNPAVSVTIPKVEKKMPAYFTEKEVEMLVDLPDLSSNFGVRNKAILELMYSCGLRISEVSGAKLGNFSKRSQLIKVLGKGSKERIIPIGRKAMEALEDYLKIRYRFLSGKSDDSIFLSKSGKPLHSDEIRAILDRYIQLIARKKGYSAHTIRHSFATHLLSKGADLKAIKEMLGHENLSTTEKYTHLSLKDINKAYRLAHPRNKEDGEV